MSLFRSMSDLKNKTAEILKLARKSHESIFITKNGKANMVVMSLAQYGKIELYGKLSVAEAQFATGDRGRPLNKVMKGIKKRIQDLK